MSTSNICRLCSRAAPITFPILNSAAAEMLDVLTAIKIGASDPISTMCLKCSLNLKLAYTIQRNFLRNEEKLRSGFLNYQNNENVKIEIFEEIIKEEPELTVCKICDAVVDSNSFTSHTQNHFKKQFCDLCSKTFEDIKAYRSHLSEHPNYSPYKCDECDTTFLYKSLYDIHKKNVHATKIVEKPVERKTVKKSGYKPKTERKNNQWNVKGPPFICATCEKVYPTKTKLRHHFMDAHQKKECPVCKKFITPSNFRKHVVNHDANPHVCETCGKTYMSREKLRSHVFYQHQAKLFECKHCEIIFETRNLLVYHRMQQHRSGCICETCGKKFLCAYELKKHTQRVHLKLKPHACQICNKKFSSLKNVKSHLRQHTNETPYKCGECGEGFKQNISLRMHKKSKHNFVEEVTCNCEFCGRGFASAHALKTHVLKRH